jgi:hypothetical protein
VRSASEGYAAAIRLPGNKLRWAALEIREAQSNDTILLAKPCLTAALRDERDLLELLPSPPIARPARRPVIEPAAVMRV